MKKFFYILALIASTSAANAATIVTDNSYGINLSGGGQLTSGVVRYGYFTSAVAFGSDTVAQLNNKFFELASYAVAGATWNGVGLTYSTVSHTAGDGVTTRPYDSTPLDNSVNAGSSAGQTVYAWVLNNSTIGSATQQGIFSNPDFFKWTDLQQPGGSDSGFSFDLGIDNGTIAHIGTANADGTGPHTLASIGAVPEPSRAFLGLLGLGALFFRRRRA